MTTVAKQLQEIPAIKDLRHLLTLLFDKKEQKTAKEFLAKYQELHDGINTNLISQGFGEANAKLVTQSAADRRLAVEELANAQREAAELLAETNTEVENARALVAEAVTEQLRQESEFETELGKTREALASRERVVASREAAVDEQTQKNVRAKERLETAQAEHEAQVERLQKALS